MANVPNPVHANYKLTFWQRVKNLWHPDAVITLKDNVFNVTYFSYWDVWKIKRSKQAKNVDLKEPFNPYKPN